MQAGRWLFRPGSPCLLLNGQSITAGKQLLSWLTEIVHGERPLLGLTNVMGGQKEWEELRGERKVHRLWHHWGLPLNQALSLNCVALGQFLGTCWLL